MIKVQCVIYQWIRLDKLYKIVKSLFKYQICFQIIGRKPKNIQRITGCVYANEVGEAFVLISTPSCSHKQNKKFFNNFVTHFKYHGHSQVCMGSQSVSIKLAAGGRCNVINKLFVQLIYSTHSMPYVS